MPIVGYMQPGEKPSYRAQQRLVSLALGLRATQTAVPPGHAELKTELERAADGLVEVLNELKELCRASIPRPCRPAGSAPP